MAETEDMAPGRANGAARAVRSRVRKASARAKTDDLESQVNQLQDDIRSISRTLSRLSELGVEEVRDRAKSQTKSLFRTGKDAVESVTDEFGAVEKQIKDTIRERPLTAVIGALAVGFVLAVVTR